MNNSPYVVGGSSGSQTKYFYALRRDDEGNLFITRVDTNGSESIDAFNNNDVPVAFDGNFIDVNYFDNRDVTTHELDYTTDQVKYEQWIWDTVLKSYYLDDEGNMVVAINTYNKFNLVTDRINTNSDVTPTTFEYSLYGNLANVDVYQLLVSAGWNQIDPVQITNAGNVYSNIASIPAMTISGEYPYGITLINNGNINGANGFETTGTLSGIPGNAIFVTSVCSITNAGQILGGNSFTLADDGYAIVGISNVTLTNSGTIGDTV